MFKTKARQGGFTLARSRASASACLLHDVFDVEGCGHTTKWVFICGVTNSGQIIWLENPKTSEMCRVMFAALSFTLLICCCHQVHVAPISLVALVLIDCRFM